MTQKRSIVTRHRRPSVFTYWTTKVFHPSRRYVLDRALLVRDHPGDPVRMIGAMADMTARVKAQIRINRLQAELVHVSCVSAMGTMGSALAHEINQPLATAGNYLLACAI